LSHKRKKEPILIRKCVVSNSSLTSCANLSRLTNLQPMVFTGCQWTMCTLTPKH